ncbi:MAG: elongation factor P maturation arginine rhamnosyltransferase EarP [Burkholderiales bacterium]|nr:elongation factor P maturation arginine rhamnosyltransferase EarP [Burkholderiales bacterium]
MPPTLRWDIVCRVVDNFGDAGVCFRLARTLAAEHGIVVTLWIDDVTILAHIVPSLRGGHVDAVVDGVRVRALATCTPHESDLPDVVVEAFGCGLPDAYLCAMAARPSRRVWIVLEYLSAEPWIDASHALPSPHPRLPLMRWFWFPGFTAHSGGLLREADLLARRDAFQGHAGARAALWRELGVDAGDALAISLFCYPNAALPALLDAWADADERIVCATPVGTASAQIDAWTKGAVPHPGMPFVRGRLTLVAVPFVDQDAFDRRLWASDLNFVRGEDSFVRAQWAARPFVWHAYPQAADAHLAKMDAFLSRLEARLDAPTRRAVRDFWYAWNTGDAPASAAAWPAYRHALPALERAGRAWAADLAGRPDLASALVGFCESKL